MSTLLHEPECATAPPVTVLPDLFEVLDGEIVECPPMSFYAGMAANQLNIALAIHLLTNKIGWSGVELIYRIPRSDDRTRSRRPDVSFVSYERWPKTRLLPAAGLALDVIPDLAVEVVSPTDQAQELDEKVEEYLRAGVRLVWVVYPLAKKIHATRPGAREIRVYTEGDDLDGGDVLPGFHTPIAGLFPPVEPPPPLPSDE